VGKKKHAEHVNHERWLVSYADLLTLLFAFFVVLFASSVSDKKKSQKMSQAMQQAFDPGGPFDAHSKTPPIADGGGTAPGQANPLELAVETTAPRGGVNGGQADIERKALTESIKAATQQHLVRMHEAEDGITLSLDSAGFFDSGSAQIKSATLPVLIKLAAALPQGALRVEGYTDNQPIHTTQFRSNWELSTARAAAIAEVLLSASTVSPGNFSIVGYGEFHPVAANATDAGRAANRRVDIVLLRPKAAVAKDGIAKESVTKVAAETVMPAKTSDATKAGEKPSTNKALANVAVKAMVLPGR
jgi:chemotaxis protein MotB